MKFTFSVRSRQVPETPFTWAWPPRDRKSTRLNSSHVEISYAVFCLKKKKIVRTWICCGRELGRGRRTLLRSEGVVDGQDSPAGLGDVIPTLSTRRRLILVDICCTSS